jgi:hypothetical protein
MVRVLVKKGMFHVHKMESTKIFADTAAITNAGGQRGHWYMNEHLTHIELHIDKR